MEHSHGVIYKPETSKSLVDDLGQTLAASQYVRIYFVDLANIRRCRVLPIDYFLQLLQSNRPSINIGKVCLGLIYLIIAPGFSPIGEYLYVVDIATLRPCPYASGHVAVLGHFEEKTPVVSEDGVESVEVKLCPRTLLKRIVEDAQRTCDVQFLVGVEHEFILLKSTNPIVPSHIHQWSTSEAILANSKEAIVMQEIMDSMKASGLSLQMMHAESAPGQYEIVSAPLTPMDAADTVIFTRELIINIAAKHGLRATFAPRPFMTTAGSAAHVHISVHAGSGSGYNPKVPGTLSTAEFSFLQGVLDHLPAMPAITLPIPASYKRMTDGVWSGGTYICWGTENREAPIRLTNVMSPESRNFELRLIDGTANPHLALAAIIGAGVKGVKEKRALRIKDCPGPKVAAQMTEEERRALGIIQRLPLSIEEARVAFEKDAVMREIVGEEFVEKYLLVNKTLGDVLTQDDSEEAQLTRLVELY
ncbi:hypothetical protein D9758_011813 [Tetrapyrgos nigripes]|uniref:GS catalytic domain-containing protein n=1 Tax=Tetrapyrgos nigripes TaxID=182062 RepID=A0A8H5FNM8_9AGAR|nr:hypothetical protein D9758_011813 [Tetrapyrgos nigripes]